jgi:hypothetical protein
MSIYQKRKDAARTTRRAGLFRAAFGFARLSKVMSEQRNENNDRNRYAYE